MTTVDVLAAYGRQFHAVVPVQIGFSRGADGLVVRSDIKRINELKGKLIATAQFTEVDFFIRYLAQEAGLSINVLGSLDAHAASGSHQPGLHRGRRSAPASCSCTTSSRARTGSPARDLGAEGVARSSRAAAAGARPDHEPEPARSSPTCWSLHRGFAEAATRRSSQGLVQGVLEGNRMVRDKPRRAPRRRSAGPSSGRVTSARGKLAKVHLSNLPENLAFFSGAIDAAGSFGGIYQSAVLAYGSDLIKDPPDADRFASLAALQGDREERPVQGSEGRDRADPQRRHRHRSRAIRCCSKDIRFLFEPNSATLDLANQDESQNLDAIKRLLQVSPGSTILLRGHVDNAHGRGVPQDRAARRSCGTQALQAMELSKKRAGEIRQMLVRALQRRSEADRSASAAAGKSRPASNSDENRRVEVQWFTIE